MKTLIITRPGKCEKHGQLNDECRERMQLLADRIHPYFATHMRRSLICSPAVTVVTSTVVLRSLLKMYLFVPCPELWINAEHPQDNHGAFEFLREKSAATDLLIVLTHHRYVATLSHLFCQTLGIEFDSLDSVDAASQSLGIAVSYDADSEPSVTVLE